MLVSGRVPWIKSSLKIAVGSKSLGDSGFLQFSRVVSSNYGKPRKKGMT